MWVLKIIIPDKPGMLISNRTKKHDVSLHGYPLSSFEKNGKFYVLVSAILVGDLNNKKAFIKDMKKDKRTMKVEMMDEQTGFWLMEQNPSNKIFYDPMIIYAKPIVIDQKGNYLFELASMDREILNKIAKSIQEPLYGGKLIFFKKDKIRSPAMLILAPKLTEKQSYAFNLAVSEGYYGYPRKINLKNLAKITRVSYSTYEFHLRCAEKKLIPYFLENIVKSR